MRTQYRIETQHISTYRQDGVTRIKGARKSHWRVWKSYSEILGNVAAAVSYITKTMLGRHIGGIVVVRPIVDGVAVRSTTKIYQAKWGHDDIPFAQFDGVAGGYWRRQLKQEYPQLIRKIDRIAS